MQAVFLLDEGDDVVHQPRLCCDKGGGSPSHLHSLDLKPVISYYQIKTFCHPNSLLWPAMIYLAKVWFQIICDVAIEPNSCMLILKSALPPYTPFWSKVS